jgi:hypothetical protein
MLPIWETRSPTSAKNIVIFVSLAHKLDLGMKILNTKNDEVGSQVYSSRDPITSKQPR